MGIFLKQVHISTISYQCNTHAYMRHINQTSRTANTTEAPNNPFENMLGQDLPDDDVIAGTYREVYYSIVCYAETHYTILII